MLTGVGWEAENRPIRESRGVAPTVTRTRLPVAMDGRATLEFAEMDEVFESIPTVHALHAFIRYLDLDDPTLVDIKLHRSGRHPDDIYWSCDPKYVAKVKLMGRKPSGDDSELYSKLQAEKDAVVRQQAERNERIKKMRSMAGRDFNPEDIKAKLLPVFHNYGEYRVFRDKPAFRKAPEKGTVPPEENGSWEMSTLGWQRLIRDCQLLDNSISVTDVDTVFTRVDAGLGTDVNNKDDRARRYKTRDAFGDLRINFDEFQSALREAAKLRYPEAEDADRAYEALVRIYVLPHASKTPMKPQPDLDDLLSRNAMNEIRTREKTLKRVYAHYATLNMYSSTTEKITWRTIEKLNATLNEDEFVTWLVNFEVVPHLMSKGEALAIFHEVEEANDADGEVGEMLYPAFTEVLGQLAVTAFANVAPMLRNPRTDVAVVNAMRKMCENVPKQYWMMGTIGRLFRERGYFSHPGGKTLPRERDRTKAALRFAETERVTRTSRMGAWQGRLGRTGTLQREPGTRAWVPAGRSDDVRHAGPGGIKAEYGYQQSPGKLEHSHMYPVTHPAPWDTHDLAYKRAQRQREAVERLRDRARKLSENTHPSEGRAWLEKNVREHAGDASFELDDDHYASIMQRDRVYDAEDDEAWDGIEATGAHPDGGHPFVPATPFGPRRWDIRSFHTRTGYDAQPARQSLARDTFPDRTFRGISNRRRGVKYTPFYPPVERVGHGPAIGGLVRKKDEIRVRVDPLVVEPGEYGEEGAAEAAAEAAERELRQLEIEAAREEVGEEVGEDVPGTDPESYPTFEDVHAILESASPTRVRRATKPFGGGIPLVRSPGSRTAHSPRMGIAFGKREDPDSNPLRTRWAPPTATPAKGLGAEREEDPGAAVAEVEALGSEWFEELREKAMSRRSDAMLLTEWRKKLGTKEARLKNEADMETVRRGLRAQAASRAEKFGY